MILVHRILRRAFARSPLDGEGAYRFGGRWSSPGTRLAYTSEHVSLAMLEYLVHVDPLDAPRDLVLVTAEVPESPSVRRVHQEELSRNWRAVPAPAELVTIGDKFAASDSPVLVVPSALSPTEHNWLISPAHPESRRIRVVRTETFRYDERMVKSR